MPLKKSLIAIGASALLLLFLVFLGVRNYGGNVSTLLHMDVPFGERHAVPEGLVLYQDAAYDGMLYYQIARDLPELFTGQPTSYDSTYRFQRILLPLLTYAVTFGQEHAFPLAILIINILASLAALAVTLAITKKVSVHALTVFLNPAIFVGVLYSLTEPLSLLFVVLFLYVWQKNNQKITLLGLAMLMLSLLARETTVFLIGLLFLWYVWGKQWKQSLLVIIPLPIFFLWQYVLKQIFGTVGFQANSNVVSLPLEGPLTLLRWLTEGITTYRLSGLALLFFVALLCIALSREWIAKKKSIDVWCFLLSGLAATMLMMDQHMWGAITSIGRVVTPIYPVYAIYAATRDSRGMRIVSWTLIIVSIVAAIGIATVAHPFVIS